MPNQIQLVIYEGYLVNDPEMHYTQSGKEVTNFRMGSNSGYKDAEGNQVKETTWLKVTVWGPYGEVIMRLCGKGSQVIVMGKLRPGKNGSPEVYQLKDSSDYAASYEITARDVRILKGKEGAAPVAEVDPADLPF